MDELTVIYMDEGHSLISDDNLADWMHRVARESRKASLWPDDDRLVEIDDSEDRGR
jgi:hypothetical protein